MPTYELRTRGREYIGLIQADYHNGTNGSMNFGAVDFRCHARGFDLVVASFRDVHVQPIIARYTVGQRVRYIDGGPETLRTATITRIMASSIAARYEVEPEGGGEERVLHEEMIVEVLP